MMCNLPVSKTVRFAQYSQLIIVPKNNHVGLTSYSCNDVHRFREEMLRDGKAMARRLATTQPEERMEEDISKRIGIELFLSRELATRLETMRKAHSNAIISGQDHLNEEELADLSSSSSSFATKRAFKSATNLFHEK